MSIKCVVCPAFARGCLAIVTDMEARRLRYLLPNSVISYILERGLYRCVDAPLASSCRRLGHLADVLRLLPHSALSTAPYTVPLEITPTTTPAPPHAISTPEPADDGKTFFVSDSPTTPAASLPPAPSVAATATTPKATGSSLSTPTASS
jgi:hypothetical protein